MVFLFTKDTRYIGIALGVGLFLLLRKQKPKNGSTLVRKRDPQGEIKMYAKKDIDCPEGTRANRFGCCRAYSPKCNRCSEIYRDTPYRCDPKTIINN